MLVALCEPPAHRLQNSTLHTAPHDNPCDLEPHHHTRDIPYISRYSAGEQSELQLSFRCRCEAWRTTWQATCSLPSLSYSQHIASTCRLRQAHAHTLRPAGLGTPFGCGGNPLSGFPSQPMGPCTPTSVPTAPLPWRGGDGDDNIERDSHLVHTLDGCICIHLYIHLQNPSARSICKIHPSEFVCIATAISARASRVNEYILPVWHDSPVPQWLSGAPRALIRGRESPASM